MGASWRGWNWNPFDQSSGRGLREDPGANLAQLGEESNKSCEQGHVGPNPSPSQGTGAGEHKSPGMCWAESQTKLPLLLLHEPSLSPPALPATCFPCIRQFPASQQPFLSESGKRLRGEAPAREGSQQDLGEASMDGRGLSTADH